MITLKINIVTTQNYYSQTHSLMYEIKTEDIYEDCLKDKKCLTLIIIQVSQQLVLRSKNLLD